MINNPGKNSERSNKINKIPKETDLNKIYHSDVKKILDIIGDNKSRITKETKEIKEETTKNKYIEASMIQKLLSQYFLPIFYGVSADKIDKEKLLNLANLANLYGLYGYESLFMYYATGNINKKLSKNTIPLDKKVLYLEQGSKEACDFDFDKLWENGTGTRDPYFFIKGKKEIIKVGINGKSEHLVNPYIFHTTNSENIVSIIEKGLLCRTYAKKHNLPYNSPRGRTRKEDFVYASGFQSIKSGLQEIHGIGGTYILTKLDGIEEYSDFEETIYPGMICSQEILGIHLGNNNPNIKEVFEILFTQEKIDEKRRIPIIRSNGSKETHHIIIPKATPEVIIYNRKGEKTQTMDFYEFIKDNYNEKGDGKEIYNKYFSEYNFIKEQLSKYKELDKKYGNKYKDENNKNEKQKRTQDDYQEFFKYKIGNINNCFKLTFDDMFYQNLYRFIKNDFSTDANTLDEIRIFIAKEVFGEKEVATYLYKKLNS